jgi:hypothetical protein
MKGSSIFVFSYFIDGLVQYFVEPIARIFGPDDNTYPEIGVQPFEGDPYSKVAEF